MMLNIRGAHETKPPHAFGWNCKNMKNSYHVNGTRASPCIPCNPGQSAYFKNLVRHYTYFFLCIPFEEFRCLVFAANNTLYNPTRSVYVLGLFTQRAHSCVHADSTWFSPDLSHGLAYSGKHHQRCVCMQTIIYMKKKIFIKRQPTKKYTIEKRETALSLNACASISGNDS